MIYFDFRFNFELTKARIIVIYNLLSTQKLRPYTAQIIKTTAAATASLTGNAVHRVDKVGLLPVGFLDEVEERAGPVNVHARLTTLHAVREEHAHLLLLVLQLVGEHLPQARLRQLVVVEQQHALRGHLGSETVWEGGVSCGYYAAFCFDVG